MKFLKSHREMRDRLGTVRRLLDERLGGHEQPRSFGKYLHASELTREEEFCPRMVRLMDVLSVRRRPVYVPPELRATYDDGRDKQDRLTNVWLRDVARGVWRCGACGAESAFGRAPDGGRCSFGDHPIACAWRYREPVAVDRENGIRGGIDLVLDTGEAMLRPVEVKIMTQSQFKTLRAPLWEHRLRTNLYLRLIAASDFLRTVVSSAEATVIYLCRGYGTQQDDGEVSPFKEFAVRRDDGETDELVARAQLVRVSREAGTVPDERVCSTSVCSRARQCPVRKQCFSG